MGGAIIAPAALSIIITTFKDPGERARAMGIWGVVVSGGASIGVLLGGVLTHTMGWPWIFFVNTPVGLVAFALCGPLLDPDPRPDLSDGFDLPGAFLVTASIVAAVYAIVGSGTSSPVASSSGWLGGSSSAPSTSRGSSITTPSPRVSPTCRRPSRSGRSPRVPPRGP